MVRPALRSRSQARIKRKLPGNNTTVHYKRRRPAPARCPVTGLVLAGVPRMRPAKISRLTKNPKASFPTLWRQSLTYRSRQCHSTESVWKVGNLYHARLNNNY